MAFYDPRVIEVHVLLVDNNMNFLLETSRMIQFNSYKVTSVQQASVASSMLSAGNEKFDLVMVDVSSSNLEGFKLVHEAVDMGYIVILMSNDADTTLVKCAIEDGAFLFMEKVNAAEELKYIWQHVLREKARKNKENGTLLSAGTDQQPNYTAINQNDQRVNCLSGGNRNLDIDRNNNGMISTMNNRFVPAANNNVINRPIRGRLGSIVIEPDNNVRTCMKPKLCTEWTPELHDKFMAAVRELGEGRCFPKDILELMNVPGLTRLQVASHLQKCRHGWQPSFEREADARCPKVPKSSKNSKSKHSTRVKKYGLLPRVVINASQEYNNTSTDQNHVVEHRMPPFNGTQNIVVQETTLWDTNNVPNKNNMSTMNEIISGEINVNGVDMIGDDASFDFAVDEDGLIANSFDLNIDSDLNVSIQNNSEAAANQGEDFWSSLVEDFTRGND